MVMPKTDFVDYMEYIAYADFVERRCAGAMPTAIRAWEGCRQCSGHDWWVGPISRSCPVAWERQTELYD